MFSNGWTKHSGNVYGETILETTLQNVLKTFVGYI